MSLIISTSAAAASIANAQAFNAYQDVVWSMQYSLCGPTNAQAGFCAFLYDAPALTNGGIGKSLGFAPSQDYTSFTNISGASGAIVGVGFDSAGLFAVSGNGLSTGIDASQAVRNAITVRTGTNFAYVTTFAATAFDSTFTVVQSSDALQQFRFRLTDASNNMEIAHWNGESYDVWCNVPVALNLPASAFCRAGFSFASPLCGNAAIARFGIANIHFEGSVGQPTQQINDVSFECKLPVINNVSQQAPNSITIEPVVETLLQPYYPIEPPLPAPDPCDVEPAATINCGDFISYSGERGTQRYFINAGTTTGEFVIQYQAYTIPDRFTLKWNNNVATTCFVGASADAFNNYNEQLSALGYGPVVGPGYGKLKINKTAAYPTTIELQVDAPLEGTLWEVKVLCFPGPQPSLLLYKGTNTHESNLLYYNDSINLGNFGIGDATQMYFTIKNAGDGDLSSLSLVQLLTASFSQYRVNIPISVPVIKPGDSTSFGISFVPTITGYNETAFQLYSNDEFSPFIFSINAMVSSMNIPLCACPLFTTYTGPTGIFVYNIDYGENTGPIYIQAIGGTDTVGPSRFTFTYNNSTFSSGFFGNTSYNAQLTALGYPPITTSNVVAIFNAEKTSMFPRYGTLIIESPIVDSYYGTTGWDVQAPCLLYGE